MHMHDILSSLVDNVNNKIINENDNRILDLDITMSGGAFNSNYLVGCLYFLREMQEKRLIRIHRMSSCSASSLIAFLFLTNNLELFQDKLYEMIVTSFRSNKTFIFTESNFQSITDTIKSLLPPDDETTLKMVNKKLYITYFDVKRRRKIVKKKYKTVKDIFETIKKSSYIPHIPIFRRNIFRESFYDLDYKSYAKDKPGIRLDVRDHQVVSWWDRYTLWKSFWWWTKRWSEPAAQPGYKGK